MAIADAGEVQLSYERSGSGPPLLLIMGMSGTQRHWGEPFLSDLRRDFEVIVYDHRGVGESSRMAQPFTIAELAQDAAGLLAALDIARAHVVGISMGGMIAQELVLAHPQLIDTLTLGCTYCGGEGSSLTTQDVLQELTEAALSGDRDRALRAAWEANVSAELAADPGAWETFRAIGRERAVALPVVMAQMQAIGGHDTSIRLDGVRAPTLVVHGTADQMIPVANAHVIAGHIPDARVEIFDGVGHLFFWERPQRSAELVRGHALVAA
ncbi:MAG TPA: alpha/beta hydrolase [Solirubrobacteraceae bacterium]|jgi:pimeloyl-ACP methyl ester carboxylesterase